MTRKLLTLTAVYAVAAACLIWVFHGVDLAQLKSDLVTVRWPYLVAAALLNLSIYFSNAWRWKILLRPVTRARYRRTVQAIYIGLFLNDVLPLRPGEIVRCGLLSQWTRNLPFPVAVSSITIDRLLDAAWLEAGFVTVVLFTPVPKSLVYGCAVVSLILLCVTAFLVIIVRRSRPAEAARQENRFLQAWRRFVTGLRLMANTDTMFIVALLSLVALILYVLATWALIRTCRIPLSLAAAAAVLIIIRVGTALPTTPGSVGAYQFFAVLALRLFGVGKTAAAAFTVIAFAAFTLPLFLGGALALVLAGTDFSEILSLANRLRSKNSSIDSNP